MAQNKPRDDEFFNCGEEHENRYVSKLYGSNSEKVHVFLEKNAAIALSIIQPIGKFIGL